MDSLETIRCWACGFSFFVNPQGWHHCPICGAVVCYYEEEGDEEGTE